MAALLLYFEGRCFRRSIPYLKSEGKAALLFTRRCVRNSDTRRIKRGLLNAIIYKFL